MALLRYDKNKTLMLPVLNIIIFGGDSAGALGEPYLGIQCGEAFVVQAILKNNASVVKSMSDDIITSLAELGSKNRLKNGCRYLDALYLCVMCEGFPIATNQDRVLRAINASKATDEKFWSKTDVSAGNEKKIPCIGE